jgi:plasmid stability protein
MQSLTALTAYSYRGVMAVMTIRDLDDDVRDKLRVRAAQNRRSMEAEVRSILTEAVESPIERTFVEALANLGSTLRDAGLDPAINLPSREPHESRVSFE